MSSFIDVFRSMHLTGGLFLEAAFTAPWCVFSQIKSDDCAPFMPEPHAIVAYHYVSSGRLLLGVESEPPFVVTAGEIVILPRNTEHRLGSDLDLVGTSAHNLIQPAQNGGLAQIEHGGGGELTRIVCGFLGADQHSDPLLSMLPGVMKVNVADGAQGAWIESSFTLAARDWSLGRAQSPDVLSRLAELMFMEAVMRYLATLGLDENKWCDGMRDRKIAQALGLIHSRLSHRWTADELAHQVGMSRSAFATRFAQLMSAPPMHYIARQRLHEAARRLRNTRDPLARIAFDVGYESEAAFNRAYKRAFGTPPATWRNTHS